MGKMRATVRAASKRTVAIAPHLLPGGLNLVQEMNMQLAPTIDFAKAYEKLVAGDGVREYDRDPYAVTKREAQRDRPNVRLLTYLDIAWFKNEGRAQLAMLAERSPLKGTCV